MENTIIHHSRQILSFLLKTEISCRKNKFDFFLQSINLTKHFRNARHILFHLIQFNFE